MAMSDRRWHAASISEYAWEQEALDYLRKALPDEDPWHAWPLFEFVAGSGALYEVDVLVLSPKGLWLVEIKSQPGKVRGDHQVLTFRHEGGVHTIENPVQLTNRKAKSIKGLLIKANRQRGLRIPRVEPLVFLSASNLDSHLDDSGRAWVSAREDRPAVAQGKISGVVTAMKTGRILGTSLAGDTNVTSRDARGICRAVDEVVQPGSRRERIGDYRLGDHLNEGHGYQDRVARHQSMENVVRRARCYLVAQGTSREERDRIRRAAEREYTLLDSVSHAGILPVKHFTTTERGPVLMFEYDPRAQRLDHWLAERESVDVATALEIIEQILDALRTAHSKGLVHRALSPHSILVIPPEEEGGRLKVQIFNWQTAMRLSGTTAGVSATGTIHVDVLVDQAAQAYLAPESLTRPDCVNEEADIFSLGAIAYRLFAGRPPAPNHLELVRVLAEQEGLRVSAVQDGVPQELDLLVDAATHPNPTHRLNLDEFSAQLQEVWKALTQPEEGVTSDFLQAQKDHKLRDDETGELFTVVDRLGLGASALALRVKDKDDKTFVLKIARGPDHNVVLDQEHEALSGLHDSTVVRIHRKTKVCGQTTLVIQDAGESLGSVLRREGRLSLEWLQRLGEDLLRAVDYLEGRGVYHRDIKPENMGVIKLPSEGTTRLSLVLFDLSLSSAPLKQITIGTRHYLDPFLKLARPAVYDTIAERYAAAVTLYEMATGGHPRWGEELADPAVDATCELNLEGSLFPAACRDDLTEFFERALDRDRKSRFDNAREMLRAWVQVFENVDRVPISTQFEGDPEKALAEATLETPIAQLGISARTSSALDKINILNVRQLLQLREGDLIPVRGIGHQTKREIVAVRRKLKGRFPHEKERPLQALQEGELSTLSQATQATIDHLFDRFTAPIGKDTKGHTYRLALLGAGEIVGQPRHPWPTNADVAKHFSVAGPTVSRAWSQGRPKWQRSRSLKELRNDIAEIVTKHGGVMTAEELGSAILAQRGSELSQREDRMRSALAVIRATIAAEEDESEPRFQLFRREAATLVASSSEWADYGISLGEQGDALADEWPPPSPGRALESLREVKAPVDAQDRSPDDRRLVALAAAASKHAELSPGSREFYPSGLSAEHALELASGALAGVLKLTADEIRDRVKARYPKAEHLPGRPRLDRLIEEAGIGLVWDRAAQAYIRRLPSATTATSLTIFRSTTGLLRRRPPDPPEVEEANLCHKALEGALAEHRFLAVQAKPHHALVARRALVRCFPDLEIGDVDALFIQAMQAESRKIRAKWERVLTADCSAPGSSDWRRLSQLARQAAPDVEKDLLTRKLPLLVVNPGLLARYDQMQILEALRDKTGTPAGPPGCLVLIPTHVMHALPLVEDRALPLIGSIQTLQLSKHWIEQYRNGNGDNRAGEPETRKRAAR